MADTARWWHTKTEMTDEYIQLKDIHDGLMYIRSVLTQGCTLGLLASEILRVDGGIYAFAPRLPGDVTLPTLTQGGIGASSDSRRALALEVDQYLSAGDRRVVIFEDVLARPGDKWLETSPLRIAPYADEVYYLLIAEDIGTERIARTVAAGLGTYHALGLFSELAGVNLPSPNRLSRQDINAIVKFSRAMVVGAFDGESFLLFNVESRATGESATTNLGAK